MTYRVTPLQKNPCPGDHKFTIFIDPNLVITTYSVCLIYTQEYSCTKKILKHIHIYINFSLFTQSISLRERGYEIYNFLTLQLLHTKFGKDTFNSSWKDTNGQVIAMGHPSYSGDLKTAHCLWFQKVLCLHSIVKQEVHEETVPIN